MSNEQFKVGNEFAPYHRDASHVDPAYRDGWNACYYDAIEDVIPAKDAALASAQERIEALEAEKAALLDLLKKARSHLNADWDDEARVIAVIDAVMALTQNQKDEQQ